MVAHRFPYDHPRKGNLTWFQEKIHMGQRHPPGTIKNVRDITGTDGNMEWRPKIHTIREGYDQWKRKIDAVNRGEAELVLKYWSGRPYWTTPVEFLRLKQGQVGIQKIHLQTREVRIYHPTNYEVAPKSYLYPEIPELWGNDGFNGFNDFYHWFCPPLKRPDMGRVLEKTCAIIHFTKIRY